MGITGLNKWLAESYPSAHLYDTQIVNKIYDTQIVNKIYFNHIYIDLNYILHMNSYKKINIKQLISNVEYHIKNICSKYIPTQTINLCSDGAAPFAKLFVQIGRRLKDIRNTDTSNLSASTLNFTPGSIFMSTLHETFARLINLLEETFNIKVNIFNLDVGEAEIKIKKLILTNIKGDSDSTHLVVSNDADHFLIQASTLSYKNIYILMLNPHYLIVSIGKIIELHQQKYGPSKFPSFDFAFLNLLNGNDYFPKIKYSTIEKFWLAYKFTIREFGELVSSLEPFQINLKCLSKIIMRVISQTSSAYVSNATLEIYNIDAYETYLNGLSWCARMYMNGNCEDYSYIYDYDINPEPLLFYIYINRSDLTYDKITRKESISNELCLLLLMPYAAKSLCSERLHKFMEQHMMLYEEEQCLKCTDFHSKISVLNKSYEKSLKLDVSIRKQITSCGSAYKLHKQSHKKINKSIINDIQTKLNIYLSTI